MPKQIVINLEMLKKLGLFKTKKSKKSKKSKKHKSENNIVNKQTVIINNSHTKSNSKGSKTAPATTSNGYQNRGVQQPPITSYSGSFPITGAQNNNNSNLNTLLMHEQLAAYERKKNDENKRYTENEYQQQQNQQQQEQNQQQPTRFSNHGFTQTSPINNKYINENSSILYSPIVSSIGSPYIKRRYVGFADDDNIDVATTKGSDLFPVEGNITPLVETNQNLNSKFETPLIRHPKTNELKINRQPEVDNTQISQEELDKIKKVEERSKMIDDNWDVDDQDETNKTENWNKMYSDNDNIWNDANNDDVDNLLENEEEENQEEVVPEKSNDNSSEPFDSIGYYNKLHPYDKTLYDAFSKFNLKRKDKDQLSDNQFYKYFNMILDINNNNPNPAKQISVETFDNPKTALTAISNKHKGLVSKTQNEYLKK
jgi:hypothetical protein